MKQLYLFGIKVTSAEMSDIHREISRIIREDRPGFVLSANVHSVTLARRRPWLADFFKKADIVHIDGVGIILGAKFLGHTVSDRLTWADWAWPLAKHFAMEGQRLFLLGGPDGLTREAAAKLKAHAPGLQIVGAYHGYFAKQGPENDSIIEMINQANPDVLWVGLGMPLQERWILDNYQRMNVKMYMTCGAGFKHMAGWLKRSPQWFIDHHMEWFWLFLQNPRRGFIRYLYGNPAFLFYLLLEKIGLFNKQKPS